MGRFIIEAKVPPVVKDPATGQWFDLGIPEPDGESAGYVVDAGDSTWYIDNDSTQAYVFSEENAVEKIRAYFSEVEGEELHYITHAVEES